MDLEPTAEQAAVVELFAALGARWSPPAEVRRHEALGFSPALWEQLVAAGAPGMAVPEAHGGGGSGLLDLALAVEQLGRCVAAAPLVEHAVTARLLTRVAGDAPNVPTEAVVEGRTIATLALRPAVDHVARLVPGGAVADHVIALDGDTLVLASTPPPGTTIPNLASLPLADRALTGARVLATGAAAHTLHAAALDEWRALTAAALVGLGAAALELGCAYVTERQQFGVPVGSFQAVQHALADVAVGLDGARLLAHKAAWAFDCAHDDADVDAGALAGMAFLFGAAQAQLAATRALHYHGGYGFMEEYDAQLYYRRAKGWALVLDDPTLEYRRLADARYGPARAAAGAANGRDG